MGAGAGVSRLFASAGAIAAAALAIAAPAASAAPEIIAPQSHPPKADDGWQAGTCFSDPCSVETPSLFYEQAAGHPQDGFTQFIVKHTTTEVVPSVKLEEPVGDIKTVRVDLPAGLSVNPQATPQCPQATFEANVQRCAPLVRTWARAWPPPRWRASSRRRCRSTSTTSNPPTANRPVSASTCSATTST